VAKAAALSFKKQVEAIPSVAMTVKDVTVVEPGAKTATLTEEKKRIDALLLNHGKDKKTTHLANVMPNPIQKNLTKKFDDEVHYGEKRKVKKNKGPESGAKWYNMKTPEMTPSLERELKVLSLRGVLAPNKFYKRSSNSKIPKVFEMGTIVESSAEFYNRATKREKKQSLADQILEDSKTRQYAKRKFLEIMEKKMAGKIPLKHFRKKRRFDKR